MIHEEYLEYEYITMFRHQDFDEEQPVGVMFCPSCAPCWGDCYYYFLLHSFILYHDPQMHEERLAGRRSIRRTHSKTVASAKSERVEIGNKGFCVRSPLLYASSCTILPALT